MQIPFYQAKIPPRWHRCRIFWSTWKGSYAEDRCACGATRIDGPGGKWFNKNCRRTWS